MVGPSIPRTDYLWKEFWLCFDDSEQHPSTCCRWLIIVETFWRKTVYDAASYTGSTGLAWNDIINGCWLGQSFTFTTTCLYDKKSKMKTSQPHANMIWFWKVNRLVGNSTIDDETHSDVSSLGITSWIWSHRAVRYSHNDLDKVHNAYIYVTVAMPFLLHFVLAKNWARSAQRRIGPRGVVSVYDCPI